MSTSRPELRSQSLTLRSLQSAEARVLPSGENARAGTHRLGPRRRRLGSRWAATSQSLSAPSQPAVNRLLPSGENATALTAAVCPRSKRTSWQVAVFQSLTVLSLLPVARVLLSGENARESTGT